MLRRDVDTLSGDVEEKLVLHAKEIHNEESSHATFPGRNYVFSESGESLTLHDQGTCGEESSQTTFPERDFSSVFADTGGEWALRTNAGYQDKESSHGFRGHDMEFVEAEQESGLRTERVGEMKDEGMENTAQSNSNGMETSSRKNRQDSPESASISHEELRACVGVGEDIDEDDKSVQPKFAASNPRRFLRGNLKLSKLKWATFEEKPKKSLQKAGNSAKSMGSKEEIRPSSLRRQRNKAVSFDQDFLDDLSEKTDSMEESWNNYCRKNVRRDCTCEELEKTIFYQGYNLHKLRKAVVVRETLQERFTF